MEDYSKETIKTLNEISKYYEIIENFVNQFNMINYVEFDYHVVHDFTFFIVDPDFDFKKLKSQVERIIKVLSPIKRIFTNPVLHLAEKDEVLPIETVTKINNDTLNHIARHSELWSDLNNDGVKPIKLLSRTYYDNYGIYENLVFCKAIDDILHFVKRNLRILKNLDYVNKSIEFDLLQRVNHLNYFLALGKLHTGYIRNFDKHYIISKECYNGLSHIYNTIVPRLNRPVYRKNKQRPTKLKKTNILAMHRDYKHIYSLEKYFQQNKITLNYEFNKEDYLKVSNNYLDYCSILSIFSVGHFNFKCSETDKIDYKNLNILFKYKDWKLVVKHEIVDDIKVIVFNINKENNYKTVMIPNLIEEDKQKLVNSIKNNYECNEIIVATPYEKNEYETDECLIDISNLESFRRIQQFVLRGMIHSDALKEECPFCLYHLNEIKYNRNKAYVCESCRTLIVEKTCPEVKENYIYTDIIDYKKEKLSMADFGDDKWLYYRKKEGLLHFRNITKINAEGVHICPKCNKIH